MKKTLLCFLCWILIGCSQSDSIHDTNEKNSQIRDNESKEELFTNIADKSDSERESLIYKADYLTERLFEKKDIPNPTTIHCFIGDSKTNIGFVYNYDLGLTEEERKQDYKKDTAGNPYLYYGEMVQISTNIYSVKGSYPSSWKSSISKVSDEVDFYLVFNEKEMYFVFEERPIEELEKYHPSTFAKLISNYDEYFLNCHDCFTERIWNTEIEQKPSYYSAGIRIADYFEDHGFYGPSTIVIFFGQDNRDIGFTYEYGIPNIEGVDLEPIEGLGITLSYYGKLIPLTDTIFSVEGNGLLSFENKPEKISSEIDFYIKLEYDKLFIILDDLTLEELENYSSENYALFDKYIDFGKL